MAVIDSATIALLLTVAISRLLSGKPLLPPEDATEHSGRSPEDW